MVRLVPWRHHSSHNLQRGQDGIQAYGISCRWQEHMLRIANSLSSSLLMHFTTGASLTVLTAASFLLTQSDADNFTISLSLHTLAAVLLISVLARSLYIQ